MENVNTAPSIEENCGKNECEIIGGSRALKSALAEVQRVAPTDSTVLVLGETGTGKELIAEAIHKASTRRNRPFIKLNGAAIPGDLLESELFGYEKGAFTGAFAQKIGRFEMADTGTLFLDEVGDLPLALQPKLLRVLQEKERIRTPGKRQDPPHQRPSRCRDKLQSKRNGRTQAISRRPLLSLERISYCAATLARTPGGHSPTGLAFC